MKKLRMIVTSVIVFAIVGSAFTFSGKKLGKFCISVDGDNICDGVINSSKRVTSGGITVKYCPDWDGAFCVGNTCCIVNMQITTN
jgi:hypothetical protein